MTERPAGDGPGARHVLVVGGAGYVGNVLLRRLLARGYGVRCLDALLYDTGATVAPLLDEPRFSFVHGDLRDEVALDTALSGITDVVLLAALVGDPISKAYPALTRAVNLDGSKRLFDRLAGRGVGRFVFTSTCSNYGVYAGGGLATEDAPLNPKSLYAETKVAMEEHILAGRAGVDFHPTVLRISTAYGLSPRMRFDLTIAEFTRAMAMGANLEVYDEDTWRPYCHVADIADAIVTVLESPAERVSGEVFNVGDSAQNFTKRMIVEAVRAHAPAGTVSYRAGGRDPRDYRVSFEKIAGRLGFAPRRNVRDSIARLAAAVGAGLYADVDARPGFYGNYRVRDTGAAEAA